MYTLDPEVRDLCVCVGCMQCVTTATSSALTLLVAAGSHIDVDVPIICLDALHFKHINNRYYP